MTVRDAGIDDAAIIRVVAAAAWRATYRGLLADRTIEAFVDFAYSIERLHRRIERHTFLVAEQAGSIVAFADALVEGVRLNLAAMYADPDRRGQVAGTLLLMELRTRFPDRPISADVLFGNRRGELFYEARGFVPGEAVEADLFGEPVVERRWWLAARLDG